MRRRRKEPNRADDPDLSYEQLLEEAELALNRGDVDRALALSEAAERLEPEGLEDETVPES